MKDDHRLKITVLKDRNKILLTEPNNSKQIQIQVKVNSLSRLTIFRKIKKFGLLSNRCANEYSILSNKF